MLPDLTISTLFFFNSKSVTIFISKLCTEVLFTLYRRAFALDETDTG